MFLETDIASWPLDSLREMCLSTNSSCEILGECSNSKSDGRIGTRGDGVVLVFAVMAVMVMMMMVDIIVNGGDGDGGDNLGTGSC